MRHDVSEYASADIKRAATVTLHPSAGFPAIITGTAVDGIDVSAYVDSCRQGAEQATVRFRHLDAAFLASQPRPGQIISISADGRMLFNGVIDAVNDYREARGDRLMQVVARTRDGLGPWRRQRMISNSYSAGTDVGRICRDIAEELGLAADEYNLPDTGVVVPHTNAQMADMTPWDMLEAALLPSGQSPFCDALGRIRALPRDVARPADIVYGLDRVLEIKGSKATVPFTAVRLSWLDRNLSKVQQQDQPLGEAAITAGYFRRQQRRDVWFSEDRSQRAESTYMVVKQSVNDGLVPVGDEVYTEVDQHHGLITVTTDSWVPTLVTISLVALLAKGHLPDYAPAGGGPTIPTGKIAHALAEVALLLIMMSMGTGVYEIRGKPFDFVHTKNITEAYNDAMPSWAHSVKELDNDFVFDETHAQQVATRELLFESARVNTWGVTLVDDPRIEKGDILELPDRSRIYVTGYERDLTRGAQATISVEGFRA